MKTKSSSSRKKLTYKYYKDKKYKYMLEFFFKLIFA